MRERIGIMAYRKERGFTNGAFLKRLVQEGQALGVEVFLFSPQDVSVAARKIRGYVPTSTGWKSSWYSWPDMVIDHYRYYPVPKHRLYLPLRRGTLFRFANSRFSNKLRVHQVLYQEEELQRWLPETHIYSREKLTEMLKRYKSIYIKPTNGTGGRSILRVERKGGSFVLYGTTKRQGKRNEVHSTLQSLTRRVEQWIESEKSGEESFFIQQGLHLALLPNRTVDARLLIQKDGSGQWTITGMGMRIGQVKSSTSNLHAGGKAVRASAFLSKQFGRQKAEAIVAECRELAFQTVEKLERHYGPMMEFGFDIGIDVDGRPWIIEINPKPGRDIFRKLGQPELYRTAVRRPMEYALYLLRKQEQEESETGEENEKEQGSACSF
ncbi:YheC/YheD family protein [Brevibacillus sp. H7]|uniref:YheC/YheD family endospore coat-associated protein n=1 Tax=Brevibacillus sp. H7 TaxID=3349138 RepID=UPI00381723B4